MEDLRRQLGMEGNLPMNAVVTAAIAELGLEVKGLNLMQKTDACLAALGTSAVAPVPVVEVAHPCRADGRGGGRVDPDG